MKIIVNLIIYKFVFPWTFVILSIFSYVCKQIFSSMVGLGRRREGEERGPERKTENTAEVLHTYWTYLLCARHYPKSGGTTQKQLSIQPLFFKMEQDAEEPWRWRTTQNVSSASCAVRCLIHLARACWEAEAIAWANVHSPAGVRGHCCRAEGWFHCWPSHEHACKAPIL